MNREELISKIESEYRDESIQSNFWENKYDLDILKELLSESLMIIDNVAFMTLNDGLFAVDFKEEDTIDMQSTIQLFEIEDIYSVTKEFVDSCIDRKTEEIAQLQFLSMFFLR